MKVNKLALIPARGGSKRVPRKNIAQFAGKPMITWTIEAALDSKVFNQVLVSTDDKEIAAIAEQSGASIIMRPIEVSDDTASLVDVINHFLENGDETVSQFCLLQANCPLRNKRDIRNSLKIFDERQPSALLSVVNYGWTPPFRALELINHRLQPVFDKWIKKKSQHYPEVVCPSGAIYWSTPAAIQEVNTLYIKGLEGFPMPWHRAIDIDTPEDMELAACIRHSLDHGFEFGD